MKNNCILWTIVFLLHLPVLPSKAQIEYTNEDSVIFGRLMKHVREKNDIIHTATFFLGTPYTGGTLESDSAEDLRINLRELDCVTFLENVIALQMTVKNGKQQFKDFCLMLQYIRYRDGIRDGYLSRLHYTSEWLDDNCRKGILALPEPASGKEFLPGVSFMSSHCDLYPVLKANPDLCVKVKDMEMKVNHLKLRYIPKEDVKNVTQEIHDGDIIAITTHIEGLDIAHMGFAIVKDHIPYLLHASSEAKKVVISDETLSDYLMKRKNHAGIIIARLIP
jgi:hypothetical protein